MIRKLMRYIKKLSSTKKAKAETCTCVQTDSWKLRPGTTSQESLLTFLKVTEGRAIENSIPDLDNIE